MICWTLGRTVEVVGALLEHGPVEAANTVGAPAAGCACAGVLAPTMTQSLATNSGLLNSARSSARCNTMSESTTSPPVRRRPQRSRQRATQARLPHGPCGNMGNSMAGVYGT